MNYKLLIIVLIGVILRIVLPADNLFSGGNINFIGVDSYYHAGQVKNMLGSFPAVPSGYNYWLYGWIVMAITWLISAGNPSLHLAEIVAIAFPVVLSAGIILFVYYIGSLLFSKKSGLFAALFVALMPGEFLNRSLLGVNDNHVAELFISTFIALMVIVIIKKRPLFRMGNIACAMAISLSIWALFYMWAGPSYFMKLMVGFVGLHDITRTTTAEAVSIFNPSTNITIYFHIVIAIVGSIVLIKYGFGIVRWLVVAWAAVMVIATGWQIRFDYYLIIPVALISGYVCDTVISSSKLKVLAVVLILLAFVSGLPVYAGMIKSDLDTPDNDWRYALNWLRDNSESDAMVIAWWNYGYWINYIAEREAYVTPSQDSHRIPIVARAFLDRDGTLPAETDYVIIDRDTAYNYTISMSLWAGYDHRDINESLTLSAMLYEERGPEYLELVHGSDVKVYKVLK